MVFLAVSKLAQPFIYFLKRTDTDLRWHWLISSNLLVQAFVSVDRFYLGEWAIALHGKGTHPCRKVADVDINKCHLLVLHLNQQKL